MQQLSNVRIVAALILGWLLFVPVVALVDRQDLFEFLNAAIMASCLGLAFGLAPETWHAIRLPFHMVKAAQVIIVGMEVGSLSCVGIFGLQYVWRVQRDEPLPQDWIVDSIGAAFARWALLSAICLILSASKPDEDSMVPGRSYRRTGAIIAAGLTLAAALYVFGFSPKT